MSTMLDEAIIDAEALREAAIGDGRTNANGSNDGW